MSCNFEHVLFGKEKMNASTVEKISLCKEYFVQCRKNCLVPKETIFNEKYMSIDYEASWRDLASGLNSLKRKTNINLFIEEII